MSSAVPSVGGVRRLEGRVALVTGASSGLGARFAKVLHAAAAHVVASQLGDRFEAVAGDITDGALRHALVARVGDFGRLDVLINNGGRCDGGPIVDQTLEELVRVVDVNLISILDLCRLSARLLFASPSPRVINVA